MSRPLLDNAKAIDPTLLADVVRQDRRDPNVQILDWTVAPLSSQGMANPDGLLVVSGHARAGHRLTPWSVVLKRIRKRRSDDDPYHGWKREILAIESGLLAGLPPVVVTPRFYA